MRKLKTLHKPRQRVRIPWLLSYLEQLNKPTRKASAATALTLADLLIIPKTRERL